MNKINVISPNPLHTIPDISEVFAKELKNILMKLKYYKGDEFEITMDSAHAIVFYSLNMCIQYQQQGGGTVPANIVDEIWGQVLKAAKREYKVCQIEEFNVEVKNVFYTKLKEPNIINETQTFWEQYRL